MHHGISLTVRVSDSNGCQIWCQGDSGKRDATSRMPVNCSVSSLISSLVMVIIAEIFRSDDLKVKGLLLMAVKSMPAAER